MLHDTATNNSTVTPSAIILLVEDNPSLLNGICDLLEVNDLGYNLQVMTAGNGMAGLEMMDQTEPHLIISDIMMPKMDGFQFLKQVRQRPEWIHIPFIFLTAKGKEQDIVEGRLSGAELYITKPFNSTELIELAQTQLKRAFALQKSRQQAMDGLKQNILQIINHEFRTPLTYVTAYYEMLESSVAETEDQEDLEMYLRGIQAGCLRLSHLIEDMIAVVELRSGEALATFHNRARRFGDIGKHLRQVVAARQADAEEAGVTLQSHIPDTTAVLFGDQAALEDVVDRLVDNAIKFTRAKFEGEKAVHVALEVVEDVVKLTVTDSGIGFPKHVSEQIFEPFVQYNRSQFEQQGSGSGLTVTKGIVEMHGGQIEAHGVEEQGSRFVVTLPLAGESAPALPARPADLRGRVKASILIVEDDKYLLEGLREMLELDERAYHFDVYTAVNGEKALAVLAESSPDLIISDVMMPQMGGYELLDRVRQNPDWVKIPFIFLTARGERAERHKGLRSGVAEYISKPYDSDYLIDMVVTLLDRRFQVERVVDHTFDELKQSILSMLQPEFRQPLDAVNSQSERLVGELQGAENDLQLRDSLKDIQTGSRQLTRLVEDFISLAEIKTGHLERGVRKRTTVIDDPGTLLMEAKLAFEMKMVHFPIAVTLQPIHLTQKLECHLAHVVDSFKRLLHITTHLGLEYGAAADSHITLGATESQTAVYFEVVLSGTRLPQPLIEQISRFFEQTEPGVLSLPDHGLALTLIAEIVRVHQGSIALQALENGFLFTVTLPTV